MPVKRDKAAREKFSYDLAGRETREHIAVAMLENENSLQDGAVGRREAALTVPGRAVYENLASVLANDDAVVAENFYVVLRSPQASRCALARAGVPHEQVAGTIRANDAHAMELDAALLGETVHDQQFVEGVLEGISCGSIRTKTVFTHLQCCPAEAAIRQKSLVWPNSQTRCSKIKLKSGWVLANGPD